MPLPSVHNMSPQNLAHTLFEQSRLDARRAQWKERRKMALFGVCILGWNVFCAAAGIGLASFVDMWVAMAIATTVLVLGIYLGVRLWGHPLS